MSVQTTASLRNDVAAAIATALNGGSLELLEGANVRATFTGLTATNTSGVVTISGTPTTPSSDVVTGIDGFNIKNSSGTIKVQGRNRSYAIAPASQSAANDTFAQATHNLVNGEVVKLTVNLPTTTPAINENQALFLEVVDAGTFKFRTDPAAAAVDITAVAAGDTTVTVFPLAVGDANSTAVVKISVSGGSGTVFATTDSVSFTDFDIIPPSLGGAVIE